MSMTLEKAILRARKLLAMADANTNEHEAAQAAEKAMVLIRDYQLTEAQVRLVDSTAKPEAIIESFKLEGHDAKKRVAWKGSLAHAVADSVGAVMWWHGADIVCFGRESAVQTWNYTTQYLIREVDRLCEERWASDEGANARDAGHSTKAWKNAFRLGASHRIATRLRETSRFAKTERKTTIAKAMQVHDEAHDPNTQALALIERDEEEVQTKYAAKEKAEGFTRVSIGKSVRSRTGYDAGRDAGNSVSLSTNRAGLARGQGRIGRED